MSVQIAELNELDNIAPLIAKFRVELNSLKRICSDENIQAAKEELSDYLNRKYPVFIAKKESSYIGYCVCRIDENVVWLESLYVLPEYRRTGIATKLFNTAQQLAKSYGEETLYIYVHPNNDGMIAFLRRNGYSTLNLIEIRKKYHNEAVNEQIKIGNNVFDY